MHKHAITLNKPLPQTGSFVLHLFDVVAKLRNLTKIEIQTDNQNKWDFTCALNLPKRSQLSQHPEIQVGEYSIQQSVKEKCDRCGETQPMLLIELQGRQFVCRNCREPQPNFLQMPKTIRLTV